MRASAGLRPHEGLVRIRAWNAFASNNSGSYTIVGSFTSADVATEVAAELSALVRAHAAWLEVDGAKEGPAAEGESPLRVFAKKHELTPYEDDGYADDWPRYSNDNTPQTFAVDRNVVIHHDYTVTLPRLFGEYFYARGGRVSHELNHAHHPLVAVFEFWFPWQKRVEANAPARVTAVLRDLHADDGPLVKDVPFWHLPAWQAKDSFGDPTLTVGAIFDDLLPGFTAVARIAAVHGFRLGMKVFETFDGADFLAFMRPSAPRLEGPLHSVHVRADELSVKELQHVLRPFAHTTVGGEGARGSARVALISGLVRARAERVAVTLGEAGATVSIEAD